MSQSTRRDFLAQGFITGSAMIMAPSLLGLFGKAGIAQAQECGVAVGGVMFIAGGSDGERPHEVVGEKRRNHSSVESILPM